MDGRALLVVGHTGTPIVVVVVGKRAPDVAGDERPRRGQDKQEDHHALRPPWWP